MTARHVRPLYDTVRVHWRRLREAGIAAPIDDAVFHYVLVGAASLPYVNAPEARLLTGAEPSDRSWVERHADGLVATFLLSAFTPATLIAWLAATMASGAKWMDGIGIVVSQVPPLVSISAVLISIVLLLSVVSLLRVRSLVTVK